MKAKILFILLLCLGFLDMSSQITGTVFKDGNGDGVKQSGELSVAGITVNAYNATGTLCGSAVSSAGTSPNYSITGSCSGAIRLEFIIPVSGSGCGPDAALDFSADFGSSSKTSVQFVNYPSTNNNFGIQSNDFYVTTTNPIMYIPCYVNGFGAQGTTSGDGDVLVGFNYLNSGIPISQGGSAPNPIHLAYNYQIGTTWGLAYSKQASRIFVSAFLKRHSGMGPDGPGAIYMINPASPPGAGVIPSFTSLDALGFATSGSGSYSPTPSGFNPVIGTNNQRALPSDKLQPSNDPSAFGQVGKVSLGDMDISDDGQYLFVTNLFDRKLYRIDLQNPASPVVPTASQVKRYDAVPWLTTSCTNGVARPFATKYYRGKIYIGVVCTGENGTYPGNLNRYANDLRAYVYEIDPAGTGAGTIVMEFPLNYDKETTGYGDNAPSHGWYKWTDTWSEFMNPPYVVLNGGTSFENRAPSHPQPILCDIEFDGDGSLIMSFADRGGHQAGVKNNAPDGNTNNGNGFSYVLGGDILRTYKSPSTCGQVLEANGVAGPYTSTSLAPTFSGGQWSGTGPSNANGVGSSFTGYYQSGSTGALVGNTQFGAGKEFYWGDFANLFGNNYPRPHHNEGVQGGLAILPSSGEVMVAAMDPVTDTDGDGAEAWSGGVISLSNSTGARNNGYNLYTQSNGFGNPQGFFGKAAGLGDLELKGEIQPIEIGNRVWLDTDGDGIQDAGETPIAGITVQLVKNGTVIATATTDANGNYYFSSGTGTNTASAIYGISQLMPNMEYIVRIPNVQGGSKQAALGTNSLTTTNADGTTNGDYRDSDGLLVGNNAEVTVMTTDIAIAGANNHTFDFGFTPGCNINAITVQSTECLDNGTPNLMTDNRLRVGILATNSNSSLTTYTVSVTGTTITPSSGSYGVGTFFTLGSGTGGSGATYTITLTDSMTPGCTASVQVVAPENCQPATQCPTPRCGTANIQVNGN